jgi:hypothetical protein
MPTVIQIVKAHLEANGFDGLFSSGNCACKKDDLAPCGEIQGDCEAGHLSKCDCDEGHDFHIEPEAKVTGSPDLSASPNGLPGESRRNYGARL